MRHKSITLLLVAVMMIAGIISLVYIPKDEFPQFDLPIGLVVGVYPGATEEEVEQQLAKPLEDFLWTFKEIDKERVSTVCQNNVCYSIVWLKSKGEDNTEFWNKLKERLPLLRAKLPAGVLGVFANEDFGDVSAMLISSESEDKTYREMDDYARALGDRLRTIPQLANIYTLGGQNEQISIYLDRDRLVAYGLNTAMVYSKLSSQSGSMITGSLDDGNLSRMLHVVPSLNSEQDIAQTIVFSDPSGTIVRLGDIAEIKREYPPQKRYIKNNGNKSMIMSLQMVSGNNIVSFGKDVKAILKDFQETLPPDVHINVITDQSEVVDESVTEFLTELLIAIASVVIVTLLMLPMRVAGVAVTTIPITIFISIAIFYVTGVEINSVTLAALIVSLGMIVDDSIVVVDCYIDRLDEGMPRWKAAITSARQFTASIITATLSISIVFFPFLFTTDNIIHDFIESFPYAITIVLTVSLLVALLVVPIIEHRFITHGFGSEHHLILERIQAVYDRIIDICFRHKKATLAIGFFTVFLGALLMLALPQRLMPRASRSLFAVEIWLPTGTDIRRTEAVADSLANMMRKDERITNITTFYGMGSPRFHVTFMPQFGGSNYAQFIVNTHSDSETQAVLDEYSAYYANYFPEAQIKFKQIEYTDATSPVEVRLIGNNLDSLHIATDRVVSLLRRNPEIETVTTSWGTQNNRLDITLHPEQANQIGMSRSLLSLNLALRYSGGIPVAKMWEADDEIAVMIKDAGDGKQNIEDFKDIRVTGLVPTLTTVPLTQIADVKPAWCGGIIQHRNGIRSASIYGTTTRGSKIGNLNKHLYAQLDTFSLPQGVKVAKGGQAESEGRYRPQMYLGMVIAIALIIFIMLFHLKSVRLMMLMMASLVFAIPGTAIGMFCSNFEFGATAILGIVSLMGIITRSGIIMVDYGEELFHQRGMTADEAAETAAKRRFRPIFLTASAASMGVIPMVIKATPLWGPMGIVICVGALVSMLYIVTIIPVVYSMVAKKEMEEF
jgi:multidrug efflux pump subunit AcrB